ncbi:MAG: hypothetical protein KF832_21635 [Caldilineaceae bacterium]|nr:hypothetical protein [Caldilineaceae bacterium]
MNLQIKPKFLALMILWCSCWLLVACIQAPTDGHAIPMPVDVEEIAGGKSMVALVYAVGPSTATQCTTLSLDRSQNVTLGDCDGKSRLLALGKRFALDWDDIQNRFASFVYETPTETLTFTGRGTVQGEAWQRAILTWARATQAELAGSQSSATGRTALSWFFGPVPGDDSVCEHLTVLTYGYGYAETVNCEGGEVIEHQGDWLTDAEMAQFDQWLYQYEPLYVERNYLDGQGEATMNAAEAAAVDQWAQTVRARIWPATE